MFVPDEDEREEGEEEEDKPGADGDKDADKEQPKPEDQEGDKEPAPGEAEASEESEEGDEPPADGAPDPALLDKLKEILDDRDDGLERKIADGIKERETAAVAEAEAEADAKEVAELFKTAEGDDEEAALEAKAKLGSLTLKRFQAARVEAPIVKRAAEKFDGEYRDGMDIILSEFGVAEVANSLTDEEKAALDPGKFANRGEWTRGVVRAVIAKAKGAKPSSEKAKAERRGKVAARAAAGGGTPRMPAGRSGEEAEHEGQSAREYILGGKDN